MISDLRFEKIKAKELLKELDAIPGMSKALQNWNIKTQALLMIVACKKLCLKNMKRMG